MKCKTVTLRKRKIKNGTQYSLCLDYYPGYRDNATMKVITREALGIYIFAKPANQQEKDFNARMMKPSCVTNAMKPFSTRIMDSLTRTG